MLNSVCFSPQAAVFPPQFRNLPDPQLELFDLDEAFSSEKARLAQITNKCNEEDLEYYANITDQFNLKGFTSMFSNVVCLSRNKN